MKVPTKIETQGCLCVYVRVFVCDELLAVGVATLTAASVPGPSGVFGKTASSTLLRARSVGRYVMQSSIRTLKSALSPDRREQQKNALKTRQSGTEGQEEGAYIQKEGGGDN